jgi:alanine-glyoxylate transaminase / serine-glyoxylate transaminase / serine-pyruvate transaminase
VDRWGERGRIGLNIPRPENRSAAVTTVAAEAGVAPRLRLWCEDEAGLTLGIGLAGPGADADALFRIGHMGHLDPPMLLGCLATVEAGLKALGVAHGEGALSAAAAAVAAAGRPARPERLAARG